MQYLLMGGLRSFPPSLSLCGFQKGVIFYRNRREIPGLDGSELDDLGLCGKRGTESHAPAGASRKYKIAKKTDSLWSIAYCPKGSYFHVPRRFLGLRALKKLSL